jgi:D-hexose-6-phosphate mutarotase
MKKLLKKLVDNKFFSIQNIKECEATEVKSWITILITRFNDSKFKSIGINIATHIKEMQPDQLAFKEKADKILSRKNFCVRIQMKSFAVKGEVKRKPKLTFVVWWHPV